MAANARSCQMSVNLAAALQDSAMPLGQRWFPPNAQPKAHLFRTAEIEARLITTLPSDAPNFRRVLRYRPGYQRPVAK